MQFFTMVNDLTAYKGRKCLINIKNVGDDRADPALFQAFIGAFSHPAT